MYFERPPHVLIFEDSEEPFFRDLAQQGARMAGWDSLAFEHASPALHHLDESVSALVTALGTSGNINDALRGIYPATPLIIRSNNLGIPRAMMSAHPRAELYTRFNTSDTVIDKINGLYIPHKISAWLLNLNVMVHRTNQA